jgi:hypothetical protein
MMTSQNEELKQRSALTFLIPVQLTQFIISLLAPFERPRNLENELFISDIPEQPLSQGSGLVCTLSFKESDTEERNAEMSCFSNSEWH